MLVHGCTSLWFLDLFTAFVEQRVKIKELLKTIARLKRNLCKNGLT